MIRMRLGARVPNEGARRLAWWLQARDDRFRRFALAPIPMDAACVQRLLSGELEPGADVSFVISQLTGGAVVSRDWRAPAAGGWFDRPSPREYRPRVAFGERAKRAPRLPRRAAA